MKTIKSITGIIGGLMIIPLIAFGAEYWLSGKTFEQSLQIIYPALKGELFLALLVGCVLSIVWAGSRD